MAPTAPHILWARRLRGHLNVFKASGLACAADGRAAEELAEEGHAADGPSASVPRWIGACSDRSTTIAPGLEFHALESHCAIPLMLGYS